MSDSQHDAAPGMCPPRLQPCNSRNQVCRVAAHSPARRTRGPSGHLVPHASRWWRSVPTFAPLPSTGGDLGREGQPGKRPLRSVQGVLRAGPLLPGNVRVTPHPVKCMTTDTPRPMQHLWSGRGPAWVWTEYTCMPWLSPSSILPLPSISLRFHFGLWFQFYTRWFKYDRDKLWLVYTQSVPVIFEPPCISL
jgi:hypothetical protein